MYAQAFASTHCTYTQMDGQVEWAWVVGYTMCHFTHLSAGDYPSRY